MPQIAQQDYIKIRPHYATDVSFDMGAFGELLGYYNRGVITDCLVFFSGTDDGYFSRVLGMYQDGITVADRTTLKRFSLTAYARTPIQYEGLEAVQKSCGALYNAPQLTIGEDDESLAEENSHKYICVGGKLASPILDESDVITGFAINGDAPEGEFVNIEYEDLQKLIGIQL